MARKADNLTAIFEPIFCKNGSLDVSQYCRPVFYLHRRVLLVGAICREMVKITGTCT
jgi:hypothetical protein